jgi:cytochrome c
MVFFGTAIALGLVAAGSATAQEAAAGGNLQGKRLFLRCASCHEIAPSGVKRIGPSLQGVFGRKAGSLPDYAYSPAMKAADLVWDAPTLDRWLEKPSALVPGTAMAFAGLPKEADRQALIAYLKDPGQ